MRDRRTLVTALLLAAAVAGSSLATRALGAGAPAAKPAAKRALKTKEDKVRRLLEQTGAADMGKQMLESMISEVEKRPDTPAGFIKKFRTLAEKDDLVSRIVPIYARYLTDADLDGILAFYDSKAGQDLAAANPKIVQESLAAGQKWGEELAQAALADDPPDSPK